MEEFEKVIKILEVKKAYFLDIESLTEKMKYAPVDELLEIFERRGKKLEQVAELDKELNAIAETELSLKSILSNAETPDGLDTEHAVIFRSSLDIKAAANRILKMEPEVRERVENERDILLEHIEEMNNSGNSVAASYKRSVQTGVSQLSIVGNEKSI